MAALEVNSLLSVSVGPQAKHSLNCKTEDLQFKWEEDLQAWSMWVQDQNLSAFNMSHHFLTYKKSLLILPTTPWDDFQDNLYFLVCMLTDI